MAFGTPRAAGRGRSTYVNRFRCVECDTLSMGAILPFNGKKVRHWIDDRPALAAEYYVAVKCGSCRSLHFVTPLTGKGVGETARRMSIGTGPVGTTCGIVIRHTRAKYRVVQPVGFGERVARAR
jgi:hypothetical protein